jgi:mycothiol synthase
VSVELRPPRRDDATGIAAALNEFNRPAGFDLDTPEEVDVWLELPSIDFERDARVALVQGRIVGYSEASDPSGEGKLVYMEVRADPAHPQAGLALFDFAEEHARELSTPGGRVKLWAPEGAEAWHRFVESRGYVVQRQSLRMFAGLEQEPPEPEWPAGVSVRTFRREEDEQAVYELQQETFSDQRDYVPEPFEDWRHWSLRESFDPELWFLAEAGGELVGVSLCRGEWSGDAELGWVSVLGVRRSWRRKGLGAGLLRHSFRELRARGKRRVGLGVAADNPTGAVGLYERVGMSVERRILWYEKGAA